MQKLKINIDHYQNEYCLFSFFFFNMERINKTRQHTCAHFLGGSEFFKDSICNLQKFSISVSECQ